MQLKSCHILSIVIILEKRGVFMRILNARQIRDAESLCFKDYSNEAELMLKAGTACFNKMIQKYDMKNKKVAVFCGNGKNAGDGFVIARLLCSYGADAFIVICDKLPTADEPVMYYNCALNSNVKAVEFNDGIKADFIVDCIFGIGFHGEARAPFDKVFGFVNSSASTVIAVDTPSGTDATDGSACENAVKADYTIAISTLKYCHILPPSNALCGDVDVVDIGIPEACYTEAYAQTIEPELVKSVIPKVDLNANKGSRGHLLCLCGSYTMPGAAVISAKSAIRSGAGLVKITTPQSAYPLIASHLVQPIFNPLSDIDGRLSADTIDVILRDTEWASAVLLGCGLGINSDITEITKAVLKNSKSPIILDADGINSITSCIDILKEIKVPTVLTPHPGEMSRLISKPIADIQANRIAYAKSFAKQYGVILVLKGANTVVTDGESVFVNTSGNPSMAMGGTGDMLSGIIASFIAQGIKPFYAALAGVYLHGLSADMGIKKYGIRGLTVLDMIEQLGALMSEY